MGPTQAHSSSYPVHSCQYCGADLQVLYRFGDVAVPADCQCDLATAERNHREQLRQRDEEQRRQQEDERRYRERLTRSGIPARYRTGTLSDFDLTHNKAAHAAATAYVSAFGQHRRDGKGLFLIGEVGRGKTRLATIIALEVLRQGFSVRYSSTVDLLECIKAEFGTSNAGNTLRCYLDADLVVLDDIGKEHRTEWSESTIFQVINDRYERARPLILTSNLGIDDLRRHYQWSGDAIVSRIYESCQGILLTGPDRRLQPPTQKGE